MRLGLGLTARRGRATLALLLAGTALPTLPRLWLDAATWNDNSTWSDAL